MSFFYNIYVKPAYGHTPKQSQTYKDMWKAGYDFYVDDWREFSNRDTLHLIQDCAILVVFPDGEYLNLEASMVERNTQQT